MDGCNVRNAPWLAQTAPYPSAAASRPDRANGVAAGWASAASLSGAGASLWEVIVEGCAAHPDALGDLRHRDGASSKQGLGGRDVVFGQFGGPATLTATGESGFQPFHGTLAVEVEEVFRHGSVHLQGKPAVGGFTVEMLGEALELDSVHAELVDRSHHLHQGAAETVELPDY